jgi:hypothetical protein
MRSRISIFRVVLRRTPKHSSNTLAVGADEAAPGSLQRGFGARADAQLAVDILQVPGSGMP